MPGNLGSRKHSNLIKTEGAAVRDKPYEDGGGGGGAALCPCREEGAF